MNITQKYIDFAIKNAEHRLKIEGFDISMCDVMEHIVYLKQRDKTVYTTHIVDLITRKPFIEAIARGVGQIKDPIRKMFDKDTDCITYLQAIAIRDNSLEEYINNLIGITDQKQ